MLALTGASLPSTGPFGAGYVFVLIMFSGSLGLVIVFVDLWGFRCVPINFH